VSIQAHLTREESVRLTLDAMRAGELMISNGWSLVLCPETDRHVESQWDGATTQWAPGRK